MWPHYTFIGPQSLIPIRLLMVEVVPFIQTVMTSFSVERELFLTTIIVQLQIVILSELMFDPQEKEKPL